MQVHKIVELSRENPPGKRELSPWLEDLWGEVGRGQVLPVTPWCQAETVERRELEARFALLNRHLSHLPQGLRLDSVHLRVDQKTEPGARYNSNI